MGQLVPLYTTAAFLRAFIITQPEEGLYELLKSVDP
jgi:hypothetical protein